MNIQFLQEWIEHRTGILSHSRHFLYEQIPKSMGWLNTLGSIAGALLLIQILTGILMALYYVPHPEAAYESIKYVEESITLGWFIRALHYWGASFIAVAIFLHICRVFYSGAYKKPRELTWIAGLLLFFTLMGLAFTGQLLPFNQMGYWAAKVGIEIASSAPGMGQYVKEFLVGGDTVGALTLSRFYALHVVVLPGALVLLVVLHIYLLRRHGPTRPDWDQSGENISFHPYQTYRDSAAISVVLTLLILVSAGIGGPESGPADPTDTSYTPHPEWYLLSHYQLLRFTPGSMEILATFIIPNLLIAALIVLPWLDRSNSNSFQSRKWILSGGSVIIAGIVVLTAYGIATLPENETGLPAQGEGVYDIVEAGRQVYEEQNCQRCHIINGEGRLVGPELSYVGSRLKEDYMRQWLQNPQNFIPDTEMPPTEVSRTELDALVAYLQTLENMP